MKSAKLEEFLSCRVNNELRNSETLRLGNFD